MTKDHGLPPEESLSEARVRCRDLAASGHSAGAITDALVAQLAVDRDWLYLIADAEVARARVVELSR
jgi:hypothetical protein